MEPVFDVSQYYSIFKRKFWWFVVPFLAIFALAIALAVVLPSEYESKGVILIEAQEVPQDLVKTAVTGFIEQRLKSLSQVVLNRQNLLSLIKQFDLYGSIRDKATTDELVQRMRKDIFTETIQAEVGDPRWGQSQQTTVAFVVGYRGSDPQKARDVANRLASLYVEGNLENRTERVKTAHNFLQTRLQELKQQIDVSEAKLAAFKEKNLESLPELMNTNLNNLDRLQREMDAKREQIRALEDRMMYLRAEQNAMPVDTGSVVVEGQRLTQDEHAETLRAKYLELKSRYSDSHPDVVRMREQLSGMGVRSGGTNSMSIKAQELRTKEARLNELRGSYSDKHPDVVRLKEEVEELRASVSRQRSADQAISSYSRARPRNPAYVGISTQVKTIEIDVQKERKTLADMERKVHDLQANIDKTPRIEPEYNTIMREYTTAQNAYKEVQAKLQTATEAKGLEEEHIAEKLSIIDPPTLPEKPVSPKRWLIAALGFLLGLGVGVSVGAIAEVMDRTVHTGQELARMTGAPLLAVIPALRPRVGGATGRAISLLWGMAIGLGATGAALCDMLYIGIV